MAENTTEHAQKAIQDGITMLQKLAGENVKRMESFFSEVHKAQEKGIAQTQQTLDEATQLMKENMQHSLRMTAEIQKLAIATSKQTADMITSGFKG